MNFKAKEFIIKKSNYNNWDQVLSDSGTIKIKTLKTGTINTRVSGIINLKNQLASQAKKGNAKLPVFAHLINHERYGDFLIDTGFDSSFLKNQWGNFKGLIKKFYFKKRYFQEIGEGIDSQLSKMNIKLKGVFLTHFHEHAAGAPGLPDEIPYVFGNGERENKFFPLVYSDFFKKKTNLSSIDFTKAASMYPFEKVIDVFNDGSLWAISTPGHTKGHTSYLINSENQAILIVGDISPSKKGFELGVECGNFSDDLEETRKSFLQIKKFSELYPQVKLIFGHESDEFKIIYK
ncbi:MAG: MBL fold metallo-hydrolase [Clostridiaceae bacterium]